MYQFKKMYKTEDKIGNGQFIFRRYSSQPIEEEVVDERFVAFMNGELTELIPSDFGNITILPERCLYSSVGTTRKLKITLPDTITTIKAYALHNMNITEIIFPKNITKLETDSCVGSDNCIYDFSKSTQIPTLEKTDSGNNNQFDSTGSSSMVIKVPASLYNRWIADTNWSFYESKIISV